MNKLQTPTLIAVAASGLVAFVVIGALYALSTATPASPLQPQPRGIAPVPAPMPEPGRPCTMEAMQCPDGSYVGRGGPDCSFDPCPDTSAPNRVPAPAPEPTPMPQPLPRGMDCAGPEDMSCPTGYSCIEACGPSADSGNDLPPRWYCELDEVVSQPRDCPL